MISCFHTFCCKCLEEHARKSHRQRKFRCPECQAEIDLPKDNRFDRLPTSFHHNSLLGLLQKKDREALMKPPFCSQHNERIRYFCSSCEACVCPVCLAQQHQRHEFKVIEKAVQEDKKYIMSNVESLKEKANLFRADIRKLNKTSENAQTMIAIAKHEVSEAATHVIVKTRQQEEQLLKSLEMTRTKRIERINSAKQELESLVKQMNQAAEFAENLVHRSSGFDIIKTKTTLRHKFEKLHRVEVPKHRQATFVQFTAASQKDLKLGFIQLAEKPAKAANSTLEIPDQNFQAGVEAEFTLCPKTSGGETSDQAEDTDQVELLIKPAKDVTNVIVQEKEDGNLRLKFIPKVPGAYSVEVKIYGEKPPTCPFPLPVKEREIVVVGELDLKFIQGHVLKEPHGLAVNKQGDIVVIDNHGHCVYVFNKEGHCLRQIGKEGTDPGQFKYPSGVLFLNDNEIFIADQYNNRIQHLNIHPGSVLKTFGQKGEGKGQFRFPLSISLDDTERIVVTEFLNKRVQVMSREGETVFTIGDSGPERLSRPHSCIPYKNIFLVSERDNHCIKAFDSSGTFLYKFGEKGNQDGQFNTPRDMCLDGSVNLLVCDHNNNRVQQLSLDGRFTGKTIVPLQGPIRIVTTPDGRILVSCIAAKKIYILK
ncbi:tripartite motif-containing protein 3-like [Stylophora pistillata]|uniref:tripartite motif-containing protein 3-like n=1 Tax=Stylophora pistillata TaxID=50429 RepID=UPI000C0551F9|nr:tripartite motif-containing protein 3-like [Stylophora pistillata]